MTDSGPQSSCHQSALEGSRIDAKPLSFSLNTDLAKNRLGTTSIEVASGPQVDEKAWLELIRSESDHEIARRLGVTDRQVRRIKKGKVSEARLREHAKADPKYKKEDRRPCPTRARAALFPLGMTGCPVPPGRSSHRWAA